MSLVAYDNSDGSEDNDSDDEENVKNSQTCSAVSGRTSPTLSKTKLENSDLHDKIEGPIEKGSLFSTIPTPKLRESLDLSTEDDIEPYVVAQKPSKETKPVKIMVPSLSEFQDVEEPPSKRRKSVASGTGLFALLPPPKYESKKITNRTFIPHTLTKKETTTNSAKGAQLNKPKPSNLEPKLADDSDDENDSAPDFFALDNVGKVPEVNHVSEGMLASGETAINNSIGPQHGGFSHSSAEFNPNESVAINSELPEFGAGTSESDQGSNVGNLLSDEGFLRLHGKKARGLEDIQVIDINQDDQLPDGDEWRTKALSQEAEYQPSFKKGSMPSSQSRRKHQITYLAFQARAREQELKNMWAQNRFSRRQTQSKYGF